MQNTWWTNLEQMDSSQKGFISLDADGRHLLVGPPGSGKTNLLIMRARYIYGSGLKNVLLLTFTRSLQDFICTGLVSRKYLGAHQVQTFKYWALCHCATYVPEMMALYDRDGSFEEQRAQILEMLIAANQHVQGKNLYDAILVDEVQDLSLDEVKILAQLSDRVTVCGDSKQTIYQSGETVNELESLGFFKTELKFHYRIGHEISRAADRALQPINDDHRLNSNSQYREDELQSRIELVEYPTRRSQFDAMLKNIELQLRSYPGEGIGIIVPKRNMVDELQQLFSGTNLRTSVAYHSKDGAENTFQSGKLIHVIPLKSAKGVEFRAVHLFGLEELKFPQHRRELLFVAITRAKTRLNGYHSGTILGSVSTSFSTNVAPPSLEDLL